MVERLQFRREGILLPLKSSSDSSSNLQETGRGDRTSCLTLVETKGWKNGDVNSVLSQDEGPPRGGRYGLNPLLIGSQPRQVPRRGVDTRLKSFEG